MSIVVSGAGGKPAGKDLPSDDLDDDIDYDSPNSVVSLNYTYRKADGTEGIEVFDFTIGDIKKAVLEASVFSPLALIPPARVAKKMLNDMDVPCTLGQLTKHSRDGRLDIVRLLLAAGIRDHGSLRTFGRNSYSYAAQFNRVDVCTELMKHGSDPFEVDSRGRPPLFYAALNGSMDTCKQLLKLGADVDQRDEDGYTALIFASQHGRLETCILMIEMGANPKATGYDNMDAMKFALRQEKSRVLRKYLKGVLKECKVKKNKK
eukprot:TRINITY_DN23446_c0_g1_i1.p1 TRINITY_DN23446_c0_g1~~TRINITY_DN23446_c0_g1_i1.p1  ORF type:complete len:277 (+),score=62.93 TRINITY_DN23446_c0_g1_i1:48-833(+)